MARAKASSSAQSTATIGFEAKLWLTADKLRNNMDAAEYKHVVLGLIFLKYISDTFEEHRAKLLAGQGDYAGANAEDPDEYKAENVFWVPRKSPTTAAPSRKRCRASSPNCTPSSPCPPSWSGPFVPILLGSGSSHEA